MKNIWQLFKYECKNLFSDWKSLLLILAVPAMFVLVLLFGVSGMANDGGFIEPFSIAIVDHDQTLETRMMINQMVRSNELKKIVEFLTVTEEQAMSLLEESRVAVVVIIPENFGESVAYGDNFPLQVLGNEQKYLQAQLAKALLESATNLVSAAQTGIATVYEYLDAPGVLPVEVREQIWQESVYQFTDLALARKEFLQIDTISAYGVLTVVEYYTVSAILVFIVGCSLLFLRIANNNLDRKTLQRLTLRNVPMLAVIGSKWLAMTSVIAVSGFMMVSTVSAMAYTMIGKGFFDLSRAGYVAAMLLLTSGAVCSVILAWAVFVPKAGQKDFILMIGIVALLISSGIIIPLSYLSAGFSKIVALNPFYWLADAWSSALFSAAHYPIWLNVLLLGMSVLIILVYTSYRIRR